MQVTITHHIDASERDGDGYYKYYYEYDLYVFTNGELSFVARSYKDTSAEASFLRAESNQQVRPLKETDLSHPLFLEAVTYLDQLGKTKLNWLKGDYISL